MEIYGGVREGQTYALKQMSTGPWKSADGLVSFSADVSGVGMKAEMCIAREAGNGDVGARVYGTWFCRMKKADRQGNKREYGFILMEQLGKTLDRAFKEARKDNLIITPDAQKAGLGIHERFYKLGYFHDDNHLGNHAFDANGHVRLLDFGFVSPWWKGPFFGSKKEDQIKFVAKRIKDAMIVTPYFNEFHHVNDDVCSRVLSAIEKGKYKWGLMAEYTEKKVYPFPKNTEEPRGMYETEGEGEREGRGIGPLPVLEEHTLLPEDIQPFIAKQYEFFVSPARSPLFSNRGGHKKKYSVKVPEGVNLSLPREPLPCLAAPLPPPVIKVESLDECHPGLKELEKLGSGLFGKVMSVSVDVDASQEEKKKGEKVYSGLSEGETYAMKQVFMDAWTSPDGLVSFPVEMSEVGLQSEMCIAKEAGEAGVGAVVHGSWFCRVRERDESGARREFGFILMQQLGKTLDSAFTGAKTEDLIITPDTQKATFGIHEKFYELGYFHDDAHMGNHAFDSAGRVRLLDFGYVSPWWKGPFRGDKKEDQLLDAGKEMGTYIRYTPFFFGGKHPDEDVFARVQKEALQGVPPTQIKEAIEHKYSTKVPEGLDPKKFGFGFRCFSLPPTPKTIEVESIDQCHPGLQEFNQIGSGKYGTVTTVSVDTDVSEEEKKKAGEIYAGLTEGQMYALKQVMSGSWASLDSVSFPAKISEVGIRTEMCIAGEAGGAGVGASVYGRWFCRVGESKKEYGFILMEQLGKTLDSAFKQAETDDLIITSDAQRATLGIHENFYQLGYFHDDCHMGNHAFDSHGHVRLLDFGFVSPWWYGPLWGDKKEDQLGAVGGQVNNYLFETRYFKGGKHKEKDVIKHVQNEIREGTYQWGSMVQYTDKSVYPLPKNTDDRERMGGSSHSHDSGDRTIEGVSEEREEQGRGEAILLQM
eukprot:Cvel_11528.t1-p1 / transcript=Cvel_11528.t1 / gene=Cvel_11528 / organism=Chromera_velia_CCMP2878 / gene_product=hypothetical protein / transcript_product=hypothetical protein / location=Cvel_scaffold727:31903-35573(+) / protein_length=923 / sequence_SO=supercontig / SO=protein_coding / is_pseudo=false